MPIQTLKDINGGDDDDGDGSIPAHAQGKPVDGEKLSKFGPGGIYHEKQIGSLCAVHCINNLLQNGMFNEIQLGEVANGLDQQERAAMGGTSLERESANVRADGFFSVQVIFAALQNVGLTCTPIGSEHAKEALSDPTYEKAFICNRSEHWFSIRKLGNFWFDLNSTKPTPSLISDLYLTMYMSQVRDQGYSVFVVRGNFPAAAIESDPQKLQEAADACRPGAAEGSSSGHAVEAKATFNAFSGQGQSLSTAPPSAAPQIDPELAAMAEADPELAAAIAASLSTMEEAPKEMTEAEKRAEMRAKRLAAFDKK
jgi:ataxin-3